MACKNSTDVTGHSPYRRCFAPSFPSGAGGASDTVTRSEAEAIAARAVDRALDDYRLVEAFNPFARSHHSEITSASAGGSSPSARVRTDQRIALKRSVADFYGLSLVDPDKLVDMLGVERPFSDVTLAHIWPASYGNFGAYAAQMALPPNFNNQPRNFLLLDRELHEDFDGGRVAFLPSRTGVKIRVLRTDQVSAAVRALDGRALFLPRPGAVPFKRTLGWFAWLAKGASSCSEEVLGELNESISASASAEGNEALRRLVEKAARAKKITREM